MIQAPITIGGAPIPSSAPLFLGVLGIHFAAGLIAVASGIVAMLSRKAAGRHPRFGTIYFWSLGVVVVTMTALAVTRWAADYPLFILGALSFAAAVVARRRAPSRAGARVWVHVTAMGLSYILLLTAFYVDNGPHLPVWRDLPHVTYWLVPFLVGVPLIVRVLFVHPLVRDERRRMRTPGG
ncbi:MAG TPA: hypothetical protein VI160_02575 [Gemmatimonadales bacterium]